MTKLTVKLLSSQGKKRETTHLTDARTGEKIVEMVAPLRRGGEPENCIVADVGNVEGHKIRLEIRLY